MKISEQAKTQILKLVDEGHGLNRFDSAAFRRWSQSSYEALQFDPVQQQRFDEYCRTSCGLSSRSRLNAGVRMLQQVLYKAMSEDHPSVSAVNISRP
ncbi:MAG TPA: hypothetical protein VMC85_03705 [Desulfomonilaceae bacterium]|nr:hypothetical protein [Desulfomonilaceae bacterium]